MAWWSCDVRAGRPAAVQPRGVVDVWIAPFSGLSTRHFGALVTVLQGQGADAARKSRPWSLPPEDRALLIAAYWRTSLTTRQLAPLSGVFKSLRHHPIAAALDADTWTGPGASLVPGA